jgi:pimeloyl-ACP methyl ester carboxylesterase
MLATRPSVPLTPCADDPAWLCGSIRVPVDRARPAGRSLRIGFSVFPHTDPTSRAEDALLVSDGGPGYADTAGRGFRLFQFEPLTDQRDLLLIDNRGTGTSSPIECPQLQAGAHALGRDAFVAAVGACGTQLGDDADRYGSGDVALDIEDVRRALGYPQLTYYAQSYGTVDIQAYAVRFPHRLRAIVADAGLPVNDPAHVWGWGLDGGTSLVRAITLTCRRAPACADAQPQAARALADLARRLRRHPIDGTALDAVGRTRRVHLDEPALIQLAESHILNLGELPAADRALAVGDAALLLRLAAEAVVDPASEGNPAEYSSGDNAAASCNDQDFVWDRGDRVPVRQAKYRRALAALPAAAFAPFSKQAWIAFWIPDACLYWPAPDRFTPAVPPGATVTGVPTLILSGDLDTIVPTENTRALLATFPRAQFLDAAGAAHPAAGWSDCALARTRQFILDPGPVSNSCTAPAYVAPAVPVFPAIGVKATAATPLPGDRSLPLDRKVATVATRAVLDAWLRSFRIPGAVGSGVGLRGGTFDFDYDSFADHAVIQLHQARFTGDVAATGGTTWGYDGNQVHFEVAVTGPRGAAGTLIGDGQFGFGGPFADFTVTGSIGGRPVDVTVPAN